MRSISGIADCSFGHAAGIGKSRRRILVARRERRADEQNQEREKSHARYDATDEEEKK